jgi:endoglucanase
MAFIGAGAVQLPATVRTSGRGLAPSLPLVGVNLAGAEFGKIPGAYTIDYMYPLPEEVAYFAALGFNCVRLPFRWERLQPDLYGDFQPKEKELLTRVVEEIASRRLVTILDPHNHAKRKVRADNWASEHLIGSPTVPTDAFVDFWRRLAERFKDNDLVVFGLMNEPVDISASDWLEIANHTIGAIRKSGASNLIMVPGTAYTGAHSWLSSGNTVLANLADPLDRFAIEVHQYFDEDSSGTSPVATSGSCGSERLQGFQNWARDNGLKAFLGEFGAADNPVALNALADICREVSANPDIWIGWTAWAGGPYWPEDYMFNLDPPATGGMRKQTQVLAACARAWQRSARGGQDRR